LPFHTKPFWYTLNPAFGRVALVLFGLALAVGILVPGHAARASINWVQDNAVTGQTTVTASVAFVSNNSAGNLIVVATDFPWERSLVQVKDTAGNTYAKAMKADNTGEAATLEIWYAKNIVGGANTVKVGLDAAAGGSFDLYIHEYSGADLVSPLDVTASSIGNSTALDSGSATTNFPNELIFGFGINNSATLSTPGSTFTGRRTDGANITEDKTATTAGSYSATATINISGSWTMAMATFKPGAGCVGDDGAAVNSIATTATSVPFGIISPNTFYQGCQDLIVSTNAGNGYSVTVQESSAMRTVDGRFSIPDTTCDGGTCSESTAAAWTNATKNGFGHTCANQSMHDCNAAYASGVNFRQAANLAAGETAQSVMSSSTAATATGRVKYRLSTSAAQPAGKYTTIISYTIYATY
jgi:hypothetical protein